MPGFLLGALTSMGISGSPHGGEPFSLVIVGTVSNLFFYYLVARALRWIGYERILRPGSGKLLSCWHQETGVPASGLASS
jgi:hypothetical protein